MPYLSHALTLVEKLTNQTAGPFAHLSQPITTAAVAEPTHDLITVAPSHDHQLPGEGGAGAAVGAPTYAVALLVPLLGLAILLALGLERRLR